MQLTPYLAARLADAVYNIQGTNDVARATADYLRSTTPRPANYQGVAGIIDSFDMSGSSVAGKSGATMLMKKTGFGFVVKGIGDYSGDIAVVCRGTAAIQDWLSNANCATDISVNGLPVHAGFNRVYKSMASEVGNAMRGLNPTNIHIVGHSLGGAIANIFAANFAAQKRGNINLYTFGAPRPAFPMFSDFLTSELSFDGIRRVYATADVVPMVPLWPFVHCSREQGNLRITKGGQGLSFAAHSMQGNYLPAVAQLGWEDLRIASATAPDFKSIDYWLDQANGVSAIPFSGVTLWMLGKALQGILTLARGVVGLAFNGAMTVIDNVAMMLKYAAQMSKAIGDYLVGLVRGIFKFLGKTFGTTQAMTTGFLSYVLQMLFNSIALIARNSAV